MHGAGARGSDRRTLGWSASALIAIAALAVLLAAAPAARAGTRIAPNTRVEVTFSGSGEYVLHEHYGESEGSVDGSLTVPFNFESLFFADVKHGKLRGATGYLLNWEASSSEVADLATESGSLHQECTTVTMPLAAGAPRPALTVGTTVSVQSLTRLSVDPHDYVPQCHSSPANPYAPEPPPVLGAALAADSLDRSLPEALAAQLPGAAATIAARQAVTYPVASHGLGSGCSPALPPGCTQELHWSGTVKIEDECAKRVCIGEKTKEEAEKSAGEYAREVKRQHFNYKANCTGWALKLSKKEPGGTAFCAAMGAKWTYESVQEQHYRGIAKDPADPAWATVPKPHPPHVKHLGALRQVAPAAHLLLARYLEAAGLSGAVMTTQNRASGAVAALAEGKAGAAAALAKLGRAEVSYAKRAARLLRGQRRLTGIAAAELRRVASRLHGARSGRRARAVRRFLAGISSKRATRLDTRAAAALSGIGS